VTWATFPRPGTHPKHLSSRRLTTPPPRPAVFPTAIRPPGSSPEPPRPRWLPPGTLAGLQICRRQATDSLSKAIYVSEQVCIRWHSTGACYTAKLTFSHDFPPNLGCVLYKCAYYIRIFTVIFPCTIKSRSSLLAPAHPGGPGKRAVKWLCVLCVTVCHCLPCAVVTVRCLVFLPV